MSNPEKTDLWRGKFVVLEKHSGYSSYTMGSNHYTPGSVVLKPVHDFHGHIVCGWETLHELSTKPSQTEIAQWQAKGVTWGRLTAAVIAKLIEKAQAVEKAAPEKIAAAKAKNQAEQDAKADEARKVREAFEARVAKTQEIEGLITIFERAHVLLWSETNKASAKRLAELARELLAIKPCGGPCGRSLPASFFGFCCGFGPGGIKDERCGASICKTCMEACEGVPRDDPRSLYPEGTLYCTKHAQAAHARRAEKPKKEKAKA